MGMYWREDQTGEIFSEKSELVLLLFNFYTYGYEVFGVFLLFIFLHPGKPESTEAAMCELCPCVAMCVCSRSASVIV